MTIEIVYKRYNPSNLECNKTYPLRRKWNLWFDSFHMHKSYKDLLDQDIWINNIYNVYIIDNAHDFWILYNNTIDPSNMWQNSSYYYFTDGYPKLNDNAEINFKILKNQDINNIWLTIILSIIGESIKYSNYIKGVSIHCMKNYYNINIFLYEINNDNITLDIRSNLESLFEKYI
jgi:hypothetical protein